MQICVSTHVGLNACLRGRASCRRQSAHAERTTNAFPISTLKREANKCIVDLLYRAFVVRPSNINSKNWYRLATFPVRRYSYIVNHTLLKPINIVMKNTTISSAMFLASTLYLFIGCEKATLPAGCYKATVVAYDYCAYTVKVEGGNIGEIWRGISNCVTISNLPSDAQSVGSTLYFTSYRPGSGPYCTADRSYDHPRTTIELINYSKTDCSTP